jgi:hypothetical protein
MRVIGWVDNYRGFIGPLPEATAKAWAKVIAANVSGVTDAEIDAAVAALCGMDRGDRDPKPQAQHIIRAIWSARGIERADQSPERRGCEVCIDGWLSGADHPHEAGHQCAVPCLCSEGQKIMDRLYPKTRCPRTREKILAVARKRVDATGQENTLMQQIHASNDDQAKNHAYARFAELRGSNPSASFTVLIGRARHAGGFSAMAAREVRA